MAYESKTLITLTFWQFSFTTLSPTAILFKFFMLALLTGCDTILLLSLSQTSIILWAFFRLQSDLYIFLKSLSYSFRLDEFSVKNQTSRWMNQGFLSIMLYSLVGQGWLSIWAIVITRFRSLQTERVLFINFLVRLLFCDLHSFSGFLILLRAKWDRINLCSMFGPGPCPCHWLCFLFYKCL